MGSKPLIVPDSNKLVAYPVFISNHCTTKICYFVLWMDF